MPDPTPEQQRAALEKAARCACWCEGECYAYRGDSCELTDGAVDRAARIIATYLAATGREAEAEQVRRAGDV